MHLMGALGWTALAAVLIIAPLSQASKHDEKDEDCEHSDLIQAAGHVQHGIAVVEDILRQRKGPKVLGDLKSLHHQLKQFEEHKCRGENFVVCGFHTNQCVHKLLVCDGTKDCENGYDEKDCELPFHEGDKFLGVVVFDHCTHRRPKHIDFEILKVTTDKYKQNGIEAKISMDNKDELRDFYRGSVFTIHGTYDFGERVLDFTAPEADRLGFVVYMDGNSANSFPGYIGSFAHKDDCAKFEFKKIYSD